MMTTGKMSTAGENDAQLVEWSLTGDRDAFGRIVERYQSLVCSITYAATGSLSLSEDLAQETFVTAWKQLSDLREPSKLRAWLCGITRFLIGKELRRQGHEPVHAAEPLDAVQEPPAPEPSPSAQAISREEEAILWRALKQMPATYREPLILFYREHQSVARVAEELELSEDAVKQRLSRGRAMLTEQVTAFVEGALQQTTPGRAFTLGVLAALPVWTTSAKAAAVGAAAAKGSGAAKAAAATGLTGAILGPIVGVLGAWLGTKAGIELTESLRERQFMIKVARIIWTGAGLFCLVSFALNFIMRRWVKTHPVFITAAVIAWGLSYVIALLMFILWMNRTQSRIRREEAAKLPPGTLPQTRAKFFQPFEYRSRWTLFGLPLIHIVLGCKQDGKDLPAKGWIAVGGFAYGVLFAFGGLAVGTVSVGGCSLGLVAIGGGALGLLAFGGVALGLCATGGAALGYLAYGGGAMGWLGASGGSAVAHDFAVGGSAFARHANDEAARSFVHNSAFFTHASMWMESATWLLWVLMILWIIWQMTRMRRAARQRRQKQA
ncbi:MAG: sigma-70 family RNA polymerase sigma factor [Verrucomicrobiia bacterium]